MDDFAWAIGLFEGEGCITLEKASAAKAAHVRQPRMAVVSTDLDVLERFHKVVGYGKISPMRSTTNLGTKPRWVWRLSRQAAIADLLMRMMPHLGQRRWEKAQDALTYIERPRTGRYPRYPRPLAEAKADADL